MVKATHRFKKYGFSALLVLGMLLAVFITAGIFPFGKNTIAWGDMTQQALPFMIQFKDIITGNDGIFLNMANASGMNFWGVFLYFISSPFTILGIFVPREAFYEFANILILLKMVATACAATAFFSSPYTPFQMEEKVAGVLGAMYAFSGFTLLYYQNLVWLDQMIYFPLLLLGLAILIKKGQVAPYAVVLSLIIFGQFQMGYMAVLAVLLFSGIYVLLYAGKEDRGPVALRLGAGTLLAALVSGVAWLPAFFQYQKSARSISLVESLPSAEFKAPIETTLGMILCTGAILAAILYLVCNKSFRQQKIFFALTMFALMMIPLLVEPINLIWHGGGYQAFPSRYGFITVFLGLVLVASAIGLAQGDEVEVAEKAALKPAQYDGLVAAFVVWGIYIVVVGFILLFYKSEADFYVRSLWGDKNSLKWGLASMVAAALVYLTVFWLRGEKLLNRKGFLVALCCVLLVEGVYNGILYIGSPARGTEDYRTTMELAGQLPEDIGRVKMSRKYTDANMIGAMGYDSIAHYSSLTSEEYLTAYKKLGYSGYWMELSGLGGSVISDNFMGIGAVICQKDEIDPHFNRDKVLFENDSFALVEGMGGEYGQVVQATPDEIEFLPGYDRFANQDWLYQTVYGGDGELCIRYEPEVTTGTDLFYDSFTKEFTVTVPQWETGLLQYVIEVEERETLYFDCFRYATNSLEEIVNDGFSIVVNGVYLEGSYPNWGCNGLLNLGTFENERVVVDVQVLRTEVMNSFGVCGIREKDMQQVVENRRDADIQVNNNRITAQTVAEEGDLLLLAIPYDEGFSAKVNGIDIEVYKAADAFMAVKLQPGENTIRLDYSPKGFMLGLGLCITGILGIGYLYWAEKKMRKKVFEGPVAKKLYGVALLLLTLLFFLAMLGLYVFPNVAWVVTNN